MATERFYILALDETADYGDPQYSPLDECVAAIFGLYLVREGERIHICSTQANSYMVNLGIDVLFAAGTEEKTRNEIRESLDQANTGLYEGDYYGYQDFGQIDRRRYGRPLVVKLDARKFKGGLTGDAYRDAVWEAAQEEASMNQAMYEPRVLWPEHFEAWRRDRRANGNERPLEGYRSGRQLPLFAIAAEAAKLDYGAVKALHWY